MGCRCGEDVGTGTLTRCRGDVKWHNRFEKEFSSFLQSHTYYVTQPFHSYKSWAGLSGLMFLEDREQRKVG